MDQPLSRLEARLQRLIEEGTSRLFATSDRKAALAKQLVECMQAGIRFNGDGQLLAPAVYTINVHPDHAPALKSNEHLIQNLQVALKEAAVEAGADLASDCILHIAPAEELNAGEFRVQSAGIDDVLSQTQSLDLPPENEDRRIPEGAFLIVNGAEIFNLKAPIINIGRKNDNHLVIDNQHVSRRHAQLRAISGHYHFFDLGSTGGSTINGEETRNAVLMAGDVISLAGVPIIYAQDGVESGNETQEVHSSGAESDSTTRNQPPA